MSRESNSPARTVLSAETVAVGTELLRGRGVDTNSSRIQKRLLAIGVAARRTTVVGDGADEIAGVISRAARRSDLVLVTGGLGPTVDDRTREAAALAAGTGLEEDGDALASVEAFFERIRRPMKQGNRCQALLPRGARVLQNPVGTAPGFAMRLEGAWCFFLPGVPREMEVMLEEHVMPFIESTFPGGRSASRRLIHLCGVPESDANERIRSLMRGSDPEVGMTARDMVITVSILSFSSDAERKVDQAAQAVLAEFGSKVIGEGEGVTLPGVVVGLLKEREITLALAESCTGGLVGRLVTDVPGASAVFLEGVVAYSVAAKERTLGIGADLIERHGQVSAEVATAMAEGAARRAGSGAAIGITGIAGPGGGTAEKPVGLVYVAACLQGRTEWREFRFGGNREMVRRRSAIAGLALLRKLIIESGAPK